MTVKGFVLISVSTYFFIHRRDLRRRVLFRDFNHLLNSAVNYLLVVTFTDVFYTYRFLFYIYLNMVRESRHLWVGNLPENVCEEEIQDFFTRFGRVEKVKLLAKTSPDGGRAAFVDFVDIRSATKANEAQNRMRERELRTNYNEPGNKTVSEYARMHRLHGSYPSAGIDYGGQPVVIYAPPHGDHVIHSQSYRSVYHRDKGRPLPPSYPTRRDRSPGSHSLSDTERSPTGSKRSREYSSDSDDGIDWTCSVVVKNLPRSSDEMLKDGLYVEFQKAGEISKIKLKGQGPDKYAVIKFTKPEEAERATHSTGKSFQGQNIRVLIKGNRSKKRTRSPAREDLAFDPHATRTVFVGNIEKTMMHGELRAIFERFGEVVDVDIKKMQTGITTYAFVQYIDINSAMLAKRKMDREYIGKNIVKLGYGRGTPTNSMWIGNLPSNTVEGQLSKAFHQFGYVQRCLIDKRFWQALLRFETIEACTKAFADMHGKIFLGKRLAVDYASPACRDGFYRRMEEDGQLDRSRLEPSPTPPDAHVTFQNVARGGSYQARGNYITRPYANVEAKTGNDYRPEVHSEKGDRDMYGRDKERPRGYSPMSRSNSPKRYSPKRTLSRESISPVSSAGFYERKNKKKRKCSMSPILDGPMRKKEKRKRKEKMKSSIGRIPDDDIPVKSTKQLKREKKERKKLEKARRKAEKKQKKLKKLKSLQEKLSSIEAAVTSNFPNDKQDAHKHVERLSANQKIPNDHVENGSAPDTAEREGLKDEATEGKDVDGRIEEAGADNDANESVTLEDGELNEEETKVESQKRLSSSPVSQGEISNDELRQDPRKVNPDSSKSFDKDSGDSSSSSSDSDSTDSSSDDDDINHDDNPVFKSRKYGEAQEHKSYRHASRNENDREYDRDYKKSKERRSPSVYKKRNSSQPRAEVSKRDCSYERRRVRSPERSPVRSESRYGRTRTPPPPPPPAEKSKYLANQNPYNRSGSSRTTDTLMDLLRRFPVMWQGLLGLKNDTAAVQMHYLSGNVRLAESSLPHPAQPNEVPPTLRISQRMKLETSQLDGVDKRIQQSKEHCMLLALPCGRDPLDVHAQTRALKTGFITYLQQKQAAGIINVNQTKQASFVVHIFPPCDFAQQHLARVAPDLLNSAADSGHLMVLISPV